jgi:hypothetical protein
MIAGSVPGNVYYFTGNDVGQICLLFYSKNSSEKN